MKNITIVSPRSPFPARSDGTTIRLHPIFRYLAADYRVQLLVVDDSRSKASERAMEANEYCHEVLSFSGTIRPVFSRKVGVALGILSPARAPYEFLRQDSPLIADFVARNAARNGSDVILWIGGSEATSLYTKRRHAQTSVVDWCDSPSLHLYRNAGESRFAAWRAQRCRSWEGLVRASVGASIYISEVDARFAPDYGGAVHVLPNGVLDDMPDDEALSAAGLTIGFLGNMGYGPNVDAAVRLHDIFQQLRAKFDELNLKIIGRAPTSKIVELASPHVEVTGAVDSIWPHLRQCDVMVFPMQTGAGLQNKILESMRAGKPVVASTICLDPLGAGVDAVALRADSNEELIKALEDLLSAPTRRQHLGKKAQEFLSRFQWEKILPEYEEVLLRAVERAPGEGKRS